MSMDSLTGLPDRQTLFANLEELFSADLSLKELTSIIVIKVNHLRQLNAQLGYSGTNQLICDVATKIADCLREHDILARVSGSEFAVVLRGLNSAAQPTLAANKILNAFNQPLRLNGENTKIHLSFGIAVSPLDGIGPEDTYRCADVALDHALTKSISIARYGDFEFDDGNYDLALERELGAAITEGQLSTVFQPIVDINSGQLKSVELLLRWHNENRGYISPDKFIPLAERSKLIIPLTTWAVNNGLREFAHCSSLDRNVSVAINISPVLLPEPNLASLIVNAAALWEIENSRITVEVTETAMMSDPDKCLAALTSLHAQGMTIAIDDFGTGYSSLEYLKKLPASILKIDKSFVTDMLTDTENCQIVQSVIDLATNMGMTVVAEGVEDDDTLDRLALMDCKRAQGYCISRPKNVEDLELWCQQNKVRAPLNPEPA